MLEREIRALDGAQFDAVVIGGGVNGAATLEHLTAAGYSCLLVEQGDFASGATSKSSRLLHCGLRHLATGCGLKQTLFHPIQFINALKTAKADMNARAEFVRSRPNRVKAFNFCMPLYKGDNYRPWSLDVAFFVLRLMCPFGPSLNYRRYRKWELKNIPIAPWLQNDKELIGAIVFREFQFDWPERVTLDAIFNAKNMGAKVLNYSRVKTLEPPDGSSSPWLVKLKRQDVDTSINIKANLVFNLSGEHVDQVIRDSGANIKKKCVGLRGAHIAVTLPKEFDDWGIFAFNSLSEPLYCLPWYGHHYIGLTRTPLKSDIINSEATDEEISWLVDELNQIMPSLAINYLDVLFSWVGVNPLTKDTYTDGATRNILLYDMKSDGLPRLFTLTGGAIITHQLVARKFVKLAKKNYPPSLLEKKDQDTIDNVQAFPKSSLSRSIETNLSKFEIEHIAREEMTYKLSDMLMRRLGLGWRSDQGIELARPVAKTMAPILGWSIEKIEEEIIEYRSLLKDRRRKYKS